MITDTIFMVRPSNFGFNPETSESNLFQNKADQEASKLEISQKAIAEFDEFVEKLTSVNLNVFVFEDTITPVKTDAVFPNNWITTHESGNVYIFPMFSKNRRQEVRQDIIDKLFDQFEFIKLIDWTSKAEKEIFLEGTGSMILDRDNGYAYACRSIRTDPALFEEFCLQENYKPVLFDAFDNQNIPIYHTNVMMALGTDFAVICLDAISNAKEKMGLINALENSNKYIIEITKEQMHHFAGNMIQLKSRSKEKYLVMSEQAYQSLTKEQLHQITQRTHILYSPLETIEKYGGGSARCMIAEIFAPKSS
jgi:hypothetical protein